MTILRGTGHEEPFGGRIVLPFLHQAVEFGAMLINRTPYQTRLTTQRYKHLIEMPGDAPPPASRLDATYEAWTKLLAPPADRLVAHDHATFK